MHNISKFMGNYENSAKRKAHSTKYIHKEYGEISH